MSSTEPTTGGRKLLTNIALLALSVVVSVLLAEAAIRVIHAFAYGFGTRYYYPIVSDPVLGWRAVENYDSRTRKQDAAGAPYEVHLTTDERGFRMFGDPASKRPKFLIVGDSFTHAVDASLEDTYYGILATKLPVEVFAYGGGGYGTLQEYLVIDRYIDAIRPDAVIVQFSSNDFDNNSVALESRSGDNNSRFRPYLMPDGTIRHAYPARTAMGALLARPRAWLGSHLRIMNEVFRAADILERFVLPRLGFRYLAPEIVGRNGDVPLFREAVGTTGEIMRMIVRRAAGARVYAFSVDDAEPYYTAFLSAARTAGIPVIDSVPRSIRREEQAGTCLRAMDRAHWSPAGHRVAAAALAAYFTKEGPHVRAR